MTTPSNAQAISDAVATSIRATIRERDETIRSVSDVSGIPYTTLQRKLTGFTSFKVTELLRIANALGIDSPVELIRDALGGDTK